jgi:hypothetical protein
VTRHRKRSNAELFDFKNGPHIFLEDNGRVFDLKGSFRTTNILFILHSYIVSSLKILSVSIILLNINISSCFSFHTWCFLPPSLLLGLGKNISPLKLQRSHDSREFKVVCGKESSGVFVFMIQSGVLGKLYFDDGFGDSRRESMRRKVVANNEGRKL